MMRNKRLKGKERKVYINDDLSSVRVKMMKSVKEQDIVKNVSTSREDSRLAAQ